MGPPAHAKLLWSTAAAVIFRSGGGQPRCLLTSSLCPNQPGASFWVSRRRPPYPSRCCRNARTFFHRCGSRCSASLRDVGPCRLTILQDFNSGCTAVVTESCGPHQQDVLVLLEEDVKTRRREQQQGTPNDCRTGSSLQPAKCWFYVADLCFLRPISGNSNRHPPATHYCLARSSNDLRSCPIACVNTFRPSPLLIPECSREPQCVIVG